MARLTTKKCATTLASILVLVSGGVGCSLTATRPIQEMSNAEAALKAAKDLNADSLVPEIYRQANEYFFKAKHNYRLKNFDQSRKNALHATRLAEQAEFEAYRLGGAAPEAASKLASPEGGLPDPETEFKSTTPTGEPTLSPTPTPAPEAGAASQEKGKDYNEVLREQEAEKKRAEEEAKKEKDKEKPGGPTGPTGTKVEPTVNFPDRVAPQSGSLPPATAGVSSQVNGGEAPPSLTPDKNSDPYWEKLEDSAAPKSHKIPKFEAKPLEEAGSKNANDKSETRTGPFKDLYKDSIPEKQGLDEVESKPLEPVEKNTKSMPDLFDKSKLEKGKDAEEDTSE